MGAGEQGRKGPLPGHLFNRTLDVQHGRLAAAYILHPRPKPESPHIPLFPTQLFVILIFLKFAWFSSQIFVEH
jgi:hypothetical protein